LNEGNAVHLKIRVGVLGNIENIGIPEESQLQDILDAIRKKNEIW
jgi:hypothetical protein